ncbi:hypothetical protein IQ227_01200 [Anabaena aphanizomenioides LEGE 00250]|uniref:Uncharacterized protein n=1 Tax=Sphaerospermopsis aphanizomenoides LEGE 00250 TaxID=2777972 RepID=A0ABR9V976_9CYAN|nr:hypothetical protein [Sphaerospermopsis aphanizomenoides LEGE 00250]
MRTIKISHKGIGVRSQESGVRSQESGVRSQESGVRSQESGVRSQEKINTPVTNHQSPIPYLIRGDRIPKLHKSLLI